MNDDDHDSQPKLLIDWFCGMLDDHQLRRQRSDANDKSLHHRCTSQACYELQHSMSMIILAQGSGQDSHV